MDPKQNRMSPTIDEGLWLDRQLSGNDDRTPYWSILNAPPASRGGLASTRRNCIWRYRGFSVFQYGNHIMVRQETSQDIKLSARLSLYPTQIGRSSSILDSDNHSRPVCLTVRSRLKIKLDTCCQLTVGLYWSTKFYERDFTISELTEIYYDWHLARVYSLN